MRPENQAPFPQSDCFPVLHICKVISITVIGIGQSPHLWDTTYYKRSVRCEFSPPDHGVPVGSVENYIYRQVQFPALIHGTPIYIFVLVIVRLEWA